MKLRSGKILNSRETVLPLELDSMLETKLQEFKTLFSGNPQHAKEVLSIVIKFPGANSRFILRDKIEEVYDDNKLPNGIHPLLAVSGDLMWLLVGNSDFYKENHIEPKYHDIIEKRMKNFDLEMPVVGSIEEYYD